MIKHHPTKNRWHKYTSQVGLDNLLAYFDGHLSGRDIMVMEFYNYESRKIVYLRLAKGWGQNVHPLTLFGLSTKNLVFLDHCSYICLKYCRNVQNLIFMTTKTSNV